MTEPFPEQSTSETGAPRPLDADLAGAKHGNVTAPLPAPAPTEQRPAAQQHAELIEAIWRDTLADSAVPLEARVAGLELVQGAVRQAGFLAALREATLRPQGRSATTEEGVPGDVSEVNLRVGSLVESLSPGSLQRFVRTRLAPTVQRLEGQNATREEVTDIVIRGLRSATGTPGVSAVARRLLGYLTGQSRRDSNYYLSVDMTGDLLARDPDARREAVVAYHTVVRGMWAITQTAPDGFVGANRRVPSTTMSSMALQVVELADDPMSPDTSRTARELLRLSAVTTEPITRQDDTWPVLVAALGFDPTDPAETVQVLHILGRVSSAWSQDNMTRSAVEAYGSVATAAVGEVRLVPARLFNGGVSIIRSRQKGRARILTRAVLNLLGVRWALEVIDSLDQFEEVGGLSCSVNFLGAVSDLSEVESDTALWTSILATARLVGSLPDIVEPADTGTHRERIAASFRGLGTTPIRPADGNELLSSVDATLDLLTAQAHPPLQWGVGLERVEQTMLTATAVGWLYRELLDHPIEELIADVARVVVDRRAAATRFVEDYRRYTAGEPPDLGRGPLVEAGLMSTDQWLRLTDELRGDPGTMTPILRAFTLADPDTG